MVSVISISASTETVALRAYLGYWLAEDLTDIYAESPIDRTRIEDNPASRPKVYANVNIQSADTTDSDRLTSLIAELEVRLNGIERIEDIFPVMDAYLPQVFKREGARQIVKGRGCETGRLLIIGDGPGRDEELSGLAFSGPQGRLMDKILKASGLTDHSYLIQMPFFAPAGGRPLTTADADIARPFLKAICRSLKPRLTLFTGTQGPRLLAGAEGTITALRGNPLVLQGDGWGETPPAVRMTLGPASLMQHPQTKAMIWADMLHYRREFRLLEV